jgi:hypothetical protein
VGPAVCIKLMMMVKGEIPPPKGGGRGRVVLAARCALLDSGSFPYCKGWVSEPESCWLGPAAIEAGAAAAAALLVPALRCAAAAQQQQPGTTQPGPQAGGEGAAA